MIDRIVETIRAAGISEERFDRDTELSRHVEQNYHPDQRVIARTRLQMIEALVINNASEMALISVRRPNVLDGLYLAWVRQGFEFNENGDLGFEDTDRYVFYKDGMEEPKLVTDQGNIGWGDWKFNALTLENNMYGFKSLADNNESTQIIFRLQQIENNVRGLDYLRELVSKMITLLAPNVAKSI